jgi:hypothetical protein
MFTAFEIFSCTYKWARMLLANETPYYRGLVGKYIYIYIYIHTETKVEKNKINLLPTCNGFFPQNFEVRDSVFFF